MIFILVKTKSNACLFEVLLFPDASDVLNNEEIMWSNPLDDDLRHFFSPIVHRITSTTHLHQQQNNNSLSTHEKKQFIGPLGCNL